MSRFVVRQNTLPYVHQWAIIDTQTGSKVSEYKKRKLAEKACSYLEKHKRPEDIYDTPLEPENVWDAMERRMKHPDGYPPQNPSKKQRKYSDKRRVELD